MTATIHIADVIKHYNKVEAVRGVSFDLAAGEMVALIGHNGAGKTTLMKMMLGLIRPTRGTIAVLGENPAAGEFSSRRQLGYLPENVAFDAALSGRETQTFYARLKREPVQEALALLDIVGLGDAAKRRVNTYSKGMRQRLGLAQALIGRPRVLLLDEPTTGLDPELRQTFYDVIQKLAAEGTTVLLSSHALTELEERAGRVIIMNRGLKVADGTLEELRRLARLPTRIRVKVANLPPAGRPAWLPATASYRRINGHIVEIDAAPNEKIELLRSATADGTAVQDLELIPPNLDELYAHFLRHAERPQ
ncbi:MULTISPECIES: ABC transporter ATP-binding protein [Bradyrhizobium]|jgi:Cu-processing system ATP-binding protein|uniref:ABC transporter ATP-binding protein n=4 Tax=Bradyrhizobium TaxID=374 RepID=A0ABS5G7N8_9BRAD|nr:MULTISPECIES: ABC transporter ATP-binding protein [Bradyrhizobium]MBR1137344.1 ABC transporter ATP-binding protein [Bradyrhizobium denitrificans]MDU1491505.1 ABC transporter ATP-binding protein [Bradyrhizobium sp.]MDU1541683.1 ABC transporter ATP-binding protein [Bradyrhizobium sp.]MDU1667803.1 ABC transporter ATP-binding protein [Bradyrhizobium sp.]MDU1688316.1 ABC transporter ATP-binding protein [Bradyrhizobium sp.]